MTSSPDMGDRNSAPLRRMPRSQDAEPRYGHSGGWVIRRETRDWNAYGVLGGNGGMVAEPKTMWSIYRAFTGFRRSVESFPTLRAARAWCDTHTWDYHERKVAELPR